MITIGADGKYHVDDVTAGAQQLFGLGRRRRGFLKRFSPLMRFMQMHKKHSLLSLVKGKKKKGGGGGPADDGSAVTDDSAQASAVPMTSQPGTPVPSTSAPAAPMDMVSQPPPPQAIIPTDYNEPPPAPSPYYAAAAQDNAEELPQTDYGQAPDYSSGFTLRAGQEDTVFNQSYGEESESGKEPPTSTQGMGACGGWITTRPSPAQHAFMSRRARSTMPTKPYRGLGQDVDFWYRPNVTFKRPVKTSRSPANERSIHRGSIWGTAIPTPTPSDPFGDGARQRHRHRRHKPSGMPF